MQGSLTGTVLPHTDACMPGFLATEPSSHPPVALRWASRKAPPSLCGVAESPREEKVLLGPLRLSFYWAPAFFKGQHWKGPHPNLVSLSGDDKAGRGPVNVASSPEARWTKPSKSVKTRDVALASHSMYHGGKEARARWGHVCWVDHRGIRLPILHPHPRCKFTSR